MADHRVEQMDPEIVPVPEQSQDGVPPVCKSRLFTWRLLGAVLALLVVLGWVFIIVMLILEEKWQLVLVAWLLLYSAAHFCYWYCKRHSLITLHRQFPGNTYNKEDAPSSRQHSRRGASSQIIVLTFFTTPRLPRGASPSVLWGDASCGRKVVFHDLGSSSVITAADLTGGSSHQASNVEGWNTHHQFQRQ
ncbi:hypothetical protein GWK47_002016 [Chionoecetes opilio]|uniref:Uncharacterized protein n=1 Tax=Chionoecetes opilio TaxID=41210 RepID=A0A8J4XVS5_CHIOP|nr:hypothetical protein GWK47_002016 [Chionoecetes opilio]